MATVASTIEAFLLPLADAFRSAGYLTTAIARNAEGSRKVAGRFDSSVNANLGRTISAVPEAVMDARRLRHQLDTFDVVVLNTPIAAGAIRAALPRHRGPLVSYIAHGFHYYPGRRDLVGWASLAVERQLASKTDLLFVMNQDDISTAITRLGYHPSKVRFLPGIGVELETYRAADVPESTRAELRSRLALHPDHRVLLVVGELSEEKRPRFALEVLSRLPDEWVVVFAGSDRGCLRELEADARRHELEGRVRFAGHLPDIRSALAISDCLLSASLREGLPRSVLEAMAFGLPVVATDIRGNRDALRSVPYCLYPPRSPATAAELVKILSGDTPVRAHFVDQCAATRGDVDSLDVATQIVRDIEDALEARDGSHPR